MQRYIYREAPTRIMNHLHAAKRIEDYWEVLKLIRALRPQERQRGWIQAIINGNPNLWQGVIEIALEELDEEIERENKRMLQ